MENTKIIKRLIQHYIEGSELTQDEHFEVRSLEKQLAAINYTRCCKGDSELLDADFGVIVGKEAHFYKDGKIIKKEALKFSNSEDLKDKTGYNNIDDTDPNWENYIKS